MTSNSCQSPQACQAPRQDPPKVHSLAEAEVIMNTHSRTPTTEGRDRELWARRLAVRDALASADLAGRHLESRRYEKELESLNDQLFPARGGRAEPPRVPEQFSYRIPILDRETRVQRGYLIADQDGVHAPDPGSEAFPPNSDDRAWLRPLEPAKPVKERATRAWHSLGHRGRPRCPGCHSRIDLVYLEFRNADPGDRFRTHPVLAVCDRTASELRRRARREIFGPTALVKRIPFPCAMATVSPEISPTLAGEPAVRPSLRGKHRNHRSLANLIPNARSASTPRKTAISIRVESAPGPLIQSPASGATRTAFRHPDAL
jgi:hypothetical protein